MDHYNPIPSLLQSINPFIDRLIEQYRSNYLSQDTQDTNNIYDSDTILELIRLASDADFIFVMNNHKNKSGWHLKSQSNLSHDINSSDYVEIIKSKVLSNISTESVFTTGNHGIYRMLYDEKISISKAFILIPLDSFNDIEFMVVCGLSKDSNYLNDAFSRIISSFYRATRNSHLQPSRIEESILDDLKRDYGFLPISLYNKRLDLFCERLSKIVIHFEPIFDLGNITITGWEALARDEESLTVPTDLFDAAELWGRRFTTQLDVDLLKLAAKSYRQASIKAKRGRPDEINPLSVNVYPETLMRKIYFDTRCATKN